MTLTTLFSLQDLTHPQPQVGVLEVTFSKGLRIFAHTLCL